MSDSQRKRLQDWGVTIGVLPTGKWNAITDVPGVKVGHRTLIEGDRVRTGITAIIPHGDNIFQHKVPAAIYVENGFGKLTGSTQIEELGNLETPIVLTNTLSVGAGLEGLIEFTLQQPGNEQVRSVNGVVGETNDGYLNDIQNRRVQIKDVLEAISAATSGPVTEGNVGAGTGTVCFGFKGGIGTASRKLPDRLGGYTVGVLVQTNFGGILQIKGVEAGKILGQYYLKNELEKNTDGSCMIVVATDAPLLSRNLKRLGKRAILGLGRTGGIAANGSGDYVISFSTAIRIPHQADFKKDRYEELRNDETSQLFLAVIEATEEAILNSLFQAETMSGVEGHRVEALPVECILSILRNKE
ncbi:MAG: P1 family peptidase [Candidatus Aminicenantes bacterium]|nr:P1 family peptidase [Candidatus Aminicenantes bacterium]